MNERLKKIQLGHHRKNVIYKNPVMYSFVDDKDFDKVNQFKWFPLKDGNTFYAVRNSTLLNGKRILIYMHRTIMKPIKSMEIDHIDRDGLNNRRSNLRISTHAENNRNKVKHIDNKSGYKCVYWHKYSKRWTSYIRVNGKAISFGYFNSKKNAYKAYINGSRKYHKEFANY